MLQPIDAFVPGERVVVTQQIPQRDEVWTTQVVGSVVRAEQVKTGSWFARAKDDKLWLDRLTLRKDDGELVVLNLDSYSHVDRIAAAEAAGRAPVGAGAASESDEQDTAA